MPPQHTLQCGVEHEAPESHEEISEVCDFKDRVVAMCPAALDSFICQVDEHNIGQGIYDLGGVVGQVVVLAASPLMRALPNTEGGLSCAYLFAPLERRRDRIPETRLVGRRVRN